MSAAPTAVCAQENTDTVSSGDALQSETESTVSSGDASNGTTDDGIHGIYVSAFVAGTRNMMDDIIANIDETSINAVVIDVKNDDGNIVFDMGSELINGLGTTNILVKDMPGLIDTLHEHGIYAIARCVTFRDPLIDEIKPEWVLKNASGGLYEDSKGFSWMDPANEEVQDYLIEVAIGCKNAGFDEVQFDYVRFPTGIKEEDLGMNGYGRRRAIYEFVRDAHIALKKEKIPLSLDVFGTAMGSKVDRNIVGQEYSWLSMCSEYLSPMIYPSHYYEGSMGLDYPDLYPYETVSKAMDYSDAELKVVNPFGDRPQAAVRPWLQGFTATYLKQHREYGVEELHDQIRAVNEHGITSWIIWNPSCKYKWEAFK